MAASQVAERRCTSRGWWRAAGVDLRQVFERLQELGDHGVLDLHAHVGDSIKAGDELKLIALELRVARFEVFARWGGGVKGRGEAIVIRL